MLNYSPLNSAALNAYGAVVITAEASCSASATLSSDPVRYAKSAATSAATATLTASAPYAVNPAAGTVSAAATALGEAYAVNPATSTVSATATLTAIAPYAVNPAASTVSAAATVSGGAYAVNPAAGSVAAVASASGTVYKYSLLGGHARPRATVWNASGLTTVHAIIPRPAQGRFVPRASVRGIANATLAKGEHSGSGVLTGAATKVQLPDGVCNCTVTIIADTSRNYSIKGDIAGAATLLGVPMFKYAGNAFYTHPAHVEPTATATVSGASVRSAGLVGEISLTGSLSGVCTPLRDALADVVCSITLAGYGEDNYKKAFADVSAAADLTVAARALRAEFVTGSISGTATVSSVSDRTAWFVAEAIDASGSLDSDPLRTTWTEADLSLTGEMDADPVRYAQAFSDITATATVLADSVYSAWVEAQPSATSTLTGWAYRVVEAGGSISASATPLAISRKLRARSAAGSVSAASTVIGTSCLTVYSQGIATAFATILPTAGKTAHIASSDGIQCTAEMVQSLDLLFKYYVTAEVEASAELSGILRANAHLFAPAYRRYYIGPEDRDIEIAYENRTVRVA